MSALTVVCPTDCGDVPGVVSFNYCGPEINFGEIYKLYIASTEAADLVNVEDPAEWASRISNTGVLDDVIREFNVILEQPEATGDKVNLGNNYKYPKAKTFTLTGKIVETNDTNYDFLRKNECAGNWKIWYATESKLYGGNAGIIANITMNEVIPVEKTEEAYFQVMIEWINEHSPVRTANIIAE